MLEVKERQYDLKSWSKKDVIIKMGRFNLHLQNFYSIISLINDTLTGVVYLAASIVGLLGYSETLSQILYIAGGVFLSFRPIIRMLENVQLREVNESNIEFKEEKQSQKEQEPRHEA